ncbi:TonB-dependent receptor [Petrimonas mucosa]|uniref:SusC/RagA family TonB-linked outer membrane protein n=1 Tax=Petrimonas mucosa TaxID=1642646 RepID=UPI00175C31F6|nr:TonB-dependent receptor [Petrimonas mucosa]HHT29380.1 TonB-dependent receptor [Petrimonas mucosa]
MKRKLIMFFSLFFAGIGILIAQTQVRGTVVDESGDPVIGATIQVKGTSQGTVSDIDGNFTLSAPAGGTLIVSYVGMQTQEIPVSANVRVVMVSDAQLLSEVVVVAYGQQRREAITGAVAQVKTEKITQRPIASATAALEGQALGVQVNNSYGEPGAEATIRIRGFNSITGSNTPLYVVDGVPMGGNVSDINPNDIESISVLKDASSAALYGNRAANGVILITTKSGNFGEEKIQVTADIKEGVYQRATKEYALLDARQFMEAQWQARRNSKFTDAEPGKYETWTDANPGVENLVKSDVGENYNIFNKSWDKLFDKNGKLIADAQIKPGYIGDLDWFKGLERTGFRQDYNLNASGGTRRTAYFFSLGYLDEEGFMKFSSGERFTGRTNITSMAAKWLKVGLNLSTSHQRYRSMSADAGSTNSFINPFMFARNMAPIYPVHLHNPETGEYILDVNGKKQYDGGIEYGRPQYPNRHVIWEYELNKDRTIRNTAEGSTFAEIYFLNDFTLKINGNMNNRTSSNSTYDNSTIGDGAGKGRMKQVDYRYKNYTLQEMLTWKKSFNDIHNVEVLAGHENYWYNYQYTYIYKQDEKLPNIMELTNFSTNTAINGYSVDYRTEGYLGRFAYNYVGKYFGEFSVRRDGSSRFHPDNRWGNFWSLGGSWVLSREDFIRQYNWINNLKFRAAYGEVGQDEGVGYYAYMGLYNSSQNGGKGAYYKIQNEATDISWEKSQSMSIALEGRYFNRLNLTVEYFDKTSKDLLFDVNRPLSIGGTPSSINPVQTMNFGSLSNRGFEIGSDVDIIRNKDWTWNFGLNLNFLNNKIKELPAEFGEEGYETGVRKYKKGHSIYDFYLYAFEGIDKSNGRSLYRLDDITYYIKDPNYKGTGASIGDDEKRLELESKNYTIIDGQAYVYNTSFAKKDYFDSAIPKVYGSFTSSLHWKNFSLSALLTYQLGGKMIDNSYMSLMSIGTTPGALHKNVLKSWTPEQAGTGIDKNGVPALNTTQSSFNNATSSRFIMSSDYLTIKNVTLGYSLPMNVIDRIGLSGVRLTASVDNLAIFTAMQGVNPQQSFGGVTYNAYVPARVAILGINVQF